MPVVGKIKYHYQQQEVIKSGSASHQTPSNILAASA